ncbi:MAG: DUF1972 domain-containing protein [Bacteroidia bacterium]|nr:DUF1972 domain-containing protein [Bacteroidia bacterium]
MKVGIIGTRGIPNEYGGYEQFAEILSVALQKRGYNIVVYNSHKHSYQEDQFHSVRIVHCFDPEYLLGTFGQFIYDLNCIRDSRSRNFDVIFQLGYTSSSIWSWLFPKKACIISNPDGLEYKRSKYNSAVQYFLKHAERWMIKYSDIIMADSVGIQKYIRKKYNKESVFISYGADVFDDPDVSKIKEFGVEMHRYNMLIARMEPENNIETIIKGVIASRSALPLLVIGKYNKSYGKYLYEKYNGEKIRFLGGIYDINKLDNLRYFSNIYFHGHSVGGTNPSLLEAMASSALICANENEFNRGVLGVDGLYFDDHKDVSKIAEEVTKSTCEKSIFTNNLKKIKEIYSWNIIVDQVDELLRSTKREK